MRLPVFLVSAVVASCASAQSLYTEPTAQQVTRLIGAVQEAGGVSGAYTAAVARTEKSLYGNSRPTYTQVETLIAAVREAGAAGSEAAEESSGRISALEGAVPGIEAGVRTNSAALASLADRVSVAETNSYSKSVSDSRYLSSESDPAFTAWAGGTNVAAGAGASAAGADSLALGYSSGAEAKRATAIGYEAIAGRESAMQLGAGTNNDAFSLQFRGTKLVNTDGKIPAASLDTQFVQPGELSAAIAGIPAPDFSSSNDTLVATIRAEAPAPDLSPYASISYVDNAVKEKKVNFLRSTNNTYAVNATGELFKTSFAKSKWVANNDGRYTASYSGYTLSGSDKIHKWNLYNNDGYKYNETSGRFYYTYYANYSDRTTELGMQPAHQDPDDPGCALTNVNYRSLGFDQSSTSLTFVPYQEVIDATPYDKFATTNEIAAALSSYAKSSDLDEYATTTDVNDLLANLMPGWTNYNNKRYAATDVCVYDGCFYECIESYQTSAASNPPPEDDTHWEFRRLDELFLATKGGTLRGDLQIVGAENSGSGGEVNFDADEGSITASGDIKTSSAVKTDTIQTADGQGSIIVPPVFDQMATWGDIGLKAFSPIVQFGVGELVIYGEDEGSEDEEPRAAEVPALKAGSKAGSSDVPVTPVAPDYSNYVFGIYKCNTTHLGDWNAEHFTKVIDLVADSEPTAGSTALLTSGAVAEAISKFGAKPTRIYNARGTNGLDDKGQLFDGAIETGGHWEVDYWENGTHLIVTPKFDSNGATAYWSVNPSSSRQVISYNKVTGEIKFYLGDTLTLSPTAPTGKDPANTAQSAELAGVYTYGKLGNWYYITATYVPQQVQLKGTPYGYFALESVPEREYTNEVYSVGDLVSYSNKAYRCTSAISAAEAWDPAHWTEIPVLAQKADYSEVQRPIVVMEYNEANAWSKFQAAISNNAVVLCKCPDGSNPPVNARMAILSYYNPKLDYVEFQYLRKITHSVKSQNDVLHIYKLTSSDVWSTSAQTTSMQVEAGAGLVSSQKSQNVVLSADYSGVVGPLFASTNTYSVGDVVIYNGVRYRCITDISEAGEWNSNFWTNETIQAVISTLASTNDVAEALASYRPKSLWADGEGYLHNATGELFRVANVDSSWVWTKENVDAPLHYSGTTGSELDDSLQYTWTGTRNGYNVLLGYNPATGVTSVKWADYGAVTYNQAAGQDPRQESCTFTNMVVTGNVYAGTYTFTPYAEGVPAPTPYDRFATTNELAVAIAGVDSKPTRIYNAAGTDALDDKGGLHDSILKDSFYTIKYNGGISTKIAPLGYYRAVEGVPHKAYCWYFSDGPNMSGQIAYDPIEGAIYDTFYNGTDQAVKLGDAPRGLDPNNEGVVLPDLTGVTMKWYGTCDLKFTPKQISLNEESYGRFALEGVPSRTIAANYSYAVGDLLGDDGKAYRCKEAYTSAASNPTAPHSDTTHWTEIPVLTNAVHEISTTITNVMDSVNVISNSIESLSNSVSSIQSTIPSLATINYVDTQLNGHKSTQLWSTDNKYLVNATGELFKTTIQNSNWLWTRSDVPTITALFNYAGTTGSGENLRYQWWHPGSSVYLNYYPIDGRFIIYNATYSTTTKLGYQLSNQDPSTSNCSFTNVTFVYLNNASGEAVFTPYGEYPDSTPYDKFATTSEVAEVVAPLAATNWVMQTVSAAIAGADSKPTRIYNAAGTDALDDKGQLFDSAVEVAGHWEVTDTVNGITKHYTLYYDGGTSQKFWINGSAMLYYTPWTGTVTFSKSGAVDMSPSVQKNLDPTVQSNSDLMAGTYTYAGDTRTVSATYVPMAYQIQPTPYAHFALESMPGREYTNIVYAVGDVVSHAGLAYRCNTAITAGEAWTPAHWTEIPTLDSLSLGFRPLAGELYDFSSNSNLVRAVEDIVRALGGSVTNSPFAGN